MNKFVLSLVITIASIVSSKAQFIDTLQTSSGLRYVIINKGQGKKPWHGQKVTIHYTLRSIDGKQLKTSKGEEPLKFTLGSEMVSRGLQEGIALMTKGDHMKFIIPSKLAFGKDGYRDEVSKKFIVKPDTDCIYEVELIDFK
ncbi:MAG TPA: FKBP-type peptidyl-prolyl cis-trans isomerase [Cytophagaceae bacterium]|jgi:FKBP-type peptidyl-prolyl cis-trans isomerase